MPYFDVYNVGATVVGTRSVCAHDVGACNVGAPVAGAYDVGACDAGAHGFGALACITLTLTMLALTAIKQVKQFSYIF